MRIFVARESDAAEPRVAATPETVKKMQALGAEIAVEPGAGVKSGILDADYAAAGATVATPQGRRQGRRCRPQGAPSERGGNRGLQGRRAGDRHHGSVRQ